MCRQKKKWLQIKKSRKWKDKESSFWMKLNKSKETKNTRKKKRKIQIGINNFEF
jgi:hypothetical protein